MGDHFTQARRVEDVHAIATRHGARSGLAVVVVLAMLATLAVVLGVAAPKAYACDYRNDPNCVGVGATSPGQPGGSGGSGGSQGGSRQVDPCARLSGYAYIVCRQVPMPWRSGGAQGACMRLYAGYSGTVSFDALNQMLTKNGCPAVSKAMAPPPSPATRAQWAAASFELPDPSGHRSPRESLRWQGYAFTYVHLPTFWWTDRSTWRSFTATARAGRNWATVTARPVALSFDPGDGSAPVSCPGPGRPWLVSDGNGAPDDGIACTYAYTDVTSSPITSTQSITWQLTWTGSGNTSGTLTSRTTSTSGQLQVLQIQVVNR